MNDTVARFQAYLVAQLVIATVGILALALGDFGGYYYRAGQGVDVYGYVYLGSGVLASVLILLGMAGLGVALYAALTSLRDEEATLETLAANADRSVRAAAFTAALAALGAVAFGAANWGVEWWLDTGFYGAFFGGLIVVGLGRLLANAVGREVGASPA